ncbi:hypothetical protein BKA66DRAFT_78476 [Pyrenochaeta sp. MPI-SDFR-AT-0127]|nr:hypothetical protein BKA66DRAFT_78476 [Pyrenochaeta sp. MPI-SDFR-AT-0127]
MLILSDFQLLTGLSIMISGFTQLRCGISTYHWHKIVRLAWFSSITHFCCLTFLRDHFHKHKSAQLWRIPGMIILVIMLTFGLIPTAQYIWYFTDGMAREDIELFVSKPAICSFFPHQNPAGFTNRAGNQRAGISITLLIFGMSVRLCRLYQAPTQICLTLRGWCSTHSRNFLGKIHSWCNLNSLFPVVTTVFLYRPLLTVFLCYRFLFDVASSKAFEVWWLVVSFAWGALSLWNSKFELEPESREWTFGQVIALVLLVAPFVALIEGYLTDAPLFRTHSSRREITPEEELPLLAPRTCTHVCLDHEALKDATLRYLEYAPDHDFYNIFSFPILSFATLVTIAQICIWTLYLLALGAFTPFDTFYIYTPYSLSMSFAVCVLNSLILSKFEPQSRKKRICLKIIYFLVYIIMLQVGITTGFMGLFMGFDMWLRIGYLALYVGLSCWHAQRMKRRLKDGFDGIWRDE